MSRLVAGVMLLVIPSALFGMLAGGIITASTTASQVEQVFSTCEIEKSALKEQTFKLQQPGRHEFMINYKVPPHTRVEPNQPAYMKPANPTIPVGAHVMLLQGQGLWLDAEDGVALFNTEGLQFWILLPGGGVSGPQDGDVVVIKAYSSVGEGGGTITDVDVKLILRTGANESID